MKGKDARYPGITIHETKHLKRGADMVIPPHIFVASDYRNHYREAIIQHGYGHYLQYKKHGFLYYYAIIVPLSIWAAIVKRDDFWTEVEANRLAHEFFGTNSLMGSKHFPV